MDYQVADFDYHLPPELIAQKPARPRDHSRLLLLDKKTGQKRHARFYDLPKFLRSGDLLVLNDSKVFPARLIGRKKDSGGRIEIFLHQPLRSGIWQCLVGGRAHLGLIVEFPGGMTAHLLVDNGDGTWQVRFDRQGRSFWQTVYRIGQVPLPPYIKRPLKTAGDRADYQTVFAAAAQTGSVAAPTAGLHFTKPLLKEIAARGVKIMKVTLHVGLGTFAPVKAGRIADHKMHREFCQVNAAVVREIRLAKDEGRRVVAVGTTSARTLESLDLCRKGRQEFWTDIFICPGYHFQAVDALITNFHLPQSTLLMLVSALAGKENIDSAYSEAIRRHYRFFSYGDAMFIC